MTSIRSLERRVVELESPEDLPPIGVVTMFRILDVETEVVDRGRRMWSIDGELYHDAAGLLDTSAFPSED